MTEILLKPEILAASTELQSIFKAAFSELGFKSGKGGWHAVKTWQTVSSVSTVPLFVAIMLDDIVPEKMSSLKGLKRKDTFFLIFQGALPARAIVDRMTHLDIRTERRVHLIESDVEDERAYIERLLLGLDSTNDDNHILDAWWEEHTFVVVAPSLKGFKKIEIPLDSLRPLKNCPKKVRQNFEIDVDGLFIYWPDLDVHLGWEQFQLATDRGALLKARQQSDQFNKAYGSAIRALRRKYALRQTDIKGLTARHIGRIERGQCRAGHPRCAHAACKGAQITSQRLPRRAFQAIVRLGLLNCATGFSNERR